jgi:hypothetical protein
MIRRFKLFLIAALLLPTALLSGCLCLSLHPLYSGKDVVFDPALLGNWTVANTQVYWSITRAGQNHYRMVYVDEDHKQGEFVARLVSVQGTMFLDLFPTETKSLPGNSFYAGHFLPVHSLFQVIRTKPTPQLAVLSEEWLRKFRARHPSAIRYEEVNGNIYLTGSPREMQRFLVAHLKTKGAFALGTPWRRKLQ